mmetsp:Transcript_22122/g.54439  ORF Transcript_22122/g.54439 Transcript_22122/m.54439 type:complete len:84 (-) Transcript_22122:244-495(-)
MTGFGQAHLPAGARKLPYAARVRGGGGATFRIEMFDRRPLAAPEGMGGDIEDTAARAAAADASDPAVACSLVARFVHGPLCPL